MGRQPTLRKKKAVKGAFKRLMSAHSKGDGLLMTIGCFFAAAAGLAGPPILGVVFAKVMSVFYNPNPDRVQEEAFFWALVLLGASVVGLICEAANGATFGRAGAHLTRNLRKQSITKWLRME